MKVVFPCSGSLVLLKQDLETLKAFYNTNLLTSKMADMYKNATTIIQIKNFNYIPKTNSLVLYNANVLTIDKMRKILGIFREQETTEKEPEEPNKDIVQESNYITDNDILSNPFFTTLAPID